MARDDFYVVYLPASSRTKRFIRNATPVIIVLVGLAAGLVAGTMRKPGDATWDLDAVTEVRGRIVDPGYPVLVDGDGGTWLLVGELKTGIRDRLGAGADGADVVVRGNTLTRGARRMLSLTSAPDTIEVLSPGGAGEIGEGARVELSGEIVDSKCFFGAMKPGNGTTHKACAILCVSGGIPPLLVTPEGEAVLLVGPDGQAFEPRWHAFIAEPVRVEGWELRPAGAYRVVRVANIERR